MPQSGVDDAGHKKPELEPDLAKKTRKVCVPDRNVKKKSDRSATRNAGEENPSRVEHGAQLEQISIQL